MATRYCAFISYSHENEAWARWLQHRLERFRVPGRLRAERPDLGGRLKPVFRDREELASSTDLGQTIREALYESAALIVICSPAAAASRWVNEEIRTFRALVPDRPVFCLLVEGGTDPEAPDCAFPPMLLRDEEGKDLPEPLAADVREHADGKRNAALKILAGLLGVGFDALRQRDAQRRMRVMAAATAVALTVAVTTAWLAIRAEQARVEAELRRNQAEDLIGFMLGDLRSNLSAIGRLDVLDAVGEQAMAYFAALGDDLSGEDALARIMALRQIGEVRFEQGQLDKALEAFSQSAQYAEDLHRREPGVDRYLFELGQARFWEGYVAWSQSRLDVAEELMNTYMAHTRELLDRAPGNTDYRLELAYAYGNLGAVARERSDAGAALEYFRQSIEAAQPLAVQEPGNTRYHTLLAESWTWVGSTLLDLKRLAEAEVAFGNALEAAQTTAELDPRPAHMDELADCLVFQAEALLQQGRLDDSMLLLERDLKVRRELVALDPQNANWGRSLARSLARIAELRLPDSQGGDAQALLGEAVQLSQKLAASDPSNTVTLKSLATVLRVEGAALLRGGQPLAALDRLNQAADLLRASSGEQQSGSPGADYAETLELAGRAWQARGETERAVKVWRQALDALPKAEQDSLVLKAIRAQLHAQLGETDAADGLIAELRGAGFRDPRYPVSGL